MLPAGYLLVEAVIPQETFLLGGLQRLVVCAQARRQDRQAPNLVLQLLDLPFAGLQLCLCANERTDVKPQRNSRGPVTTI
jgi:hypothetical protein